MQKYAPDVFQHVKDNYDGPNNPYWGANFSISKSFSFQIGDEAMHEIIHIRIICGRMIFHTKDGYLPPRIAWLIENNKENYEEFCLICWATCLPYFFGYPTNEEYGAFQVLEYALKLNNAPTEIPEKYHQVPLFQIAVESTTFYDKVIRLLKELDIPKKVSIQIEYKSLFASICLTMCTLDEGFSIEKEEPEKEEPNFEIIRTKAKPCADEIKLCVNKYKELNPNKNCSDEEISYLIIKEALEKLKQIKREKTEAFKKQIHEISEGHAELKESFKLDCQILMRRIGKLGKGDVDMPEIGTPAFEKLADEIGNIYKLISKILEAKERLKVNEFLINPENFHTVAWSRFISAVEDWAKVCRSNASDKEYLLNQVKSVFNTRLNP